MTSHIILSQQCALFLEMLWNSLVHVLRVRLVIATTHANFPCLRVKVHKVWSTLRTKILKRHPPSNLAQDIIVKKTKLSDSEKQGEGINCLLYETRNDVTVQEAEERTFEDTLTRAYT